MCCETAKSLARRCKQISAAAVWTAALWAALAAWGTSITIGPAAAATEIERQGDKLEIRAENASIKEILDVLSGQFSLAYNLSPAVHRVVTGRFSGSLQQVLTRLLAGNGYVLASSDAQIRLVVVSPSSGTAEVISEQSVPPDQNAAVQPQAAAPRTSPVGKPIPALSSYLK